MNTAAFERIIREEFPGRHFTPWEVWFCLRNRGHRGRHVCHQKIRQQLDALYCDGLLNRDKRGCILTDVASSPADQCNSRHGAGPSVHGPAPRD